MYVYFLFFKNSYLFKEKEILLANVLSVIFKAAGELLKKNL